jgi:2-keto-3-deoxy-galactonokinase
MNRHALIAVDWGTSSLRAARIAPDGEVLEERSLRSAASSPLSRRLPRRPAGNLRRLAARPGALCLVSGMAGSRKAGGSAVLRLPRRLRELAPALTVDRAEAASRWCPA